jgi:Amino acid synthesis
MMDIISMHTSIHERRIEMGRSLARPTRQVVCAAVLQNPFAGRYVDDLDELIAASVQLGEELADAAVRALGAAVESYGKGAIVGTNGELEHAAALLHPELGKPLRHACGGGAALIPSTKKRAGAGSTLDIPLHHKDAAFVRSHFDAVELRIVDAPAPDQIVLAVAVAFGGRPLARVGGLAVGDVVGQDGLR